VDDITCPDAFFGYRYPKQLYFAVNTYESIPAHAALRFVRTVLDELLLPYVPGDTVFHAGYCPVRSARFKHFKPNTINWDRIQTAFPLSEIMVRFRSERDGWSTDVGGVTASLSDDPTRASSLEFGAVPEECYGSVLVPPDIQSRVVELALSTFEAVGGVTGYITVDQVGTSGTATDSPYERWIGYSYVWASREYRQRTRGYYWGNFLSQEHVERLGGREAVRQAPVSVIREVGSGYYLQLTDNVNNIDRDKLQRLKAFLKPVLPQTPPGWHVMTEDSRRRLPDYVL